MASETGAGTISTRPGPAAPAQDGSEDLYAWTGMFINDGRMISLAWLRGYPGAVASPPTDERGCDA